MTFQEALAAHVARLQAAADATFAEYPNLKPDTISAGEPGKRYVRIIRTPAGDVSRCVVHFIEIASGTIWKAKSWKAPIRNFPRGNIYKEEA